MRVVINLKRRSGAPILRGRDGTIGLKREKCPISLGLEGTFIQLVPDALEPPPPPLALF